MNTITQNTNFLRELKMTIKQLDILTGIILMSLFQFWQQLLSAAREF